MFYKLNLQRVITVEPEHLGSILNRCLLNYLRKAVEGKPLPASDSLSAIAADYVSSSKSSAIVIAVVDIVQAQTIQGKVLDDGNVTFLLNYKAMVFKLHRGEVLDVKVESTAQEGWYGNVFGLGRIFISHSQMNEDLHNPEWHYEADSGDGVWMHSSERKSIKNGDLVRVRVVAETPQADGRMAIGSMKEKYLGPI
ncbi:DNA-directed RNA polymerase II subunit RPB7 [Strigomonas culicis]|uniref:DNA-directed RNA polymerase II subunit RPB7 n=1 Tax=Strigomonas culicis TaxID=28005 RepID=S9UYV2_9TRYP|nr:DNA-directed RNA polymerase II subunit RPB7 [Strigomonas culicis]|eukprot:EPY36017.1 DNA-directed RNA polymerase II subunit RPB7 [Strigomonas culicis]